MKILGIGVDIIQNKRIKDSIKNHKFKNRIYSTNELKLSSYSKNKIGYFSKRFAAKEAFAKALGTGFRDNLNFKDSFERIKKKSNSKINKININKIINVDTAPVLPSSKVVTKALGISATIPAKIIKDIPLPIPLWVICSPNHIKNIVPATIVVTVVILKKVPGLITKSADDSKPTERP